MSKDTKKYGILVAVDGSAESDAAVRWATREAVMRDADVTLMHVIAPVVVGGPPGICRRASTNRRSRTHDR